MHAVPKCCCVHFSPSILCTVLYRLPCHGAFPFQMRSDAHCSHLSLHCAVQAALSRCLRCAAPKGKEDPRDLMHTFPFTLCTALCRLPCHGAFVLLMRFDAHCSLLSLHCAVLYRLPCRGASALPCACCEAFLALRACFRGRCCSN